jgi:hypothetical protein
VGLKNLKIMEKKVQLLRELMEKYDLFQQDDEVGQALKELETEVDSYKGWELYREDFSENSEQDLKNIEINW